MKSGGLIKRWAPCSPVLGQVDPPFKVDDKDVARGLGLKLIGYLGGSRDFQAVIEVSA
jgi:hypothetical protein